jgi:hypothetical protein
MFRTEFLSASNSSLFSSLTIATSAAYLGSIFLLGQSFLGFKFNATHEALLTLGLVALAIWLCLVLSKHAPNYVSVAMNVQISILITSLLMIAGDISYALIQNTAKPRSSVYGYGRERDSNYLVGEYSPKTYFPTDKNFLVCKPDIPVTVSSFGSFYSSDMLDSSTLVGSTLEPHTVSITINDLGFRETEPIEDPLFKSDRFGYKLFYRPYVDLVQAPMSYVLLHPNRPKLEKVFTEIGELARNFVRRHGYTRPN